MFERDSGTSVVELGREQAKRVCFRYLVIPLALGFLGRISQQFVEEIGLRVEVDGGTGKECIRLVGR